MNLLSSNLVYTVTGQHDKAVMTIDNQMFHEIVRCYEKDLSKLCISLCRNSAEAEDLYQETWLKVLRHYNQYDSRKDFDKWLFAICVNTFKNMRTASAKRHEVLFGSEEEENFYIASIPSADVPHDVYLSLYDAVKKLPQKQRMVIVLRYFKDYSEKDIAEILNIPAGTVKSRLNKAKKLLLEVLK